MIFVSRSALFLVLLLGVASSSVLAKGVHPKTGEPLADNQTFVYRISEKPKSLDPHLVADVVGQEIVRDLFEDLLNQDENGNLVPGVATDYELSADKKTYRFHLRKTARWSNGEPVTARDFVIAWRLAAIPQRGSPYQWFMELMSLENVGAVIAGKKPPQALGVAAPDNYTLEVRLSTPLPYFPQMTTHPVTFPVPWTVIKKFGAKWTQPENIVSNGAYTLAEHNPDDSIVRVRNPRYWDNAHTILERVEARVIKDEDAALKLFFAVEIDRTEIPRGQFKRFKKTYPAETVSFPRLCSYYYAFNLSDKGPKALKDKRVRQALSMAIDRRIITEDIVGSGQTEAYSFTPPVVAGFNPPTIEWKRLSQAEWDNKAKALMADAGFDARHPLNLRLIYNTSTAQEEIAKAIVRMWKEKLSVETTLVNIEWKTYLKTRGDQDFDVARGGWCGDYNEASTFLNLIYSKSGHNDGQYMNPRVDELLTLAKTAADTTPIYAEIEQIVADDVPIIPLYHYSVAYMLHRDVANWPANNVEQKWYSKNLYKVAR